MWEKEQELPVSHRALKMTFFKINALFFLQLKWSYFQRNIVSSIAPEIQIFHEKKNNIEPSH